MAWAAYGMRHAQRCLPSRMKRTANLRTIVGFLARDLDPAPAGPFRSFPRMEGPLFSGYRHQLGSAKRAGPTLRKLRKPRSGLRRDAKPAFSPPRRTGIASLKHEVS